MKIEHMLWGTQIRYGFIWWKQRDDDKYRKLFPETEFTIDLEGTIIPNRKVNWLYRRVSIGKKYMSRFRQDEVVILEKSSDSKIVIVKKIGREYETVAKSKIVFWLDFGQIFLAQRH